MPTSGWQGADEGGAASPELALALLLLLFAVLRLGLLDIPLERDEGDYAYVAQLMRRGVAPYTGAHDLRLPGIFAAYALIFGVLGETQAAIRGGLLLVNAATLVLVFRLAQRLLDPVAAIAAAAAYGALSVSPAVLGFTANSEHFVLLPATAGLIGVLRAVETGRRLTLLGSGLLFGLAILMKQSGIFFAAFAGLLLAWQALRGPAAAPRVQAAARVLCFAAGVVLPGILAILALTWAGSLQDFWFWTVAYPVEYATFDSLEAALRNVEATLPQAVRGNAAVVALALAGLGVLLAGGRTRSARPFLVGMLGASLLAVCAGLKFRHHGYLFAALPLALLAGIGVSGAAEGLSRRGKPRLARAAVISLVLLPPLQLVVEQRGLLFRLDPQSAARSVYGVNPFPESPVVADFIRRRTQPDDRIAVLGSEPQIYFYAARRAATSHILMYPLMEPHRYARDMQQEMIRQIESERPRYLVFVRVAESWLVRATSERLLLDWAEDYLARYYRRTGLAEIDMRGTRFTWNEEAAKAQPLTEAWVGIYERIR